VSTIRSQARHKERASDDSFQPPNEKRGLSMQLLAASLLSVGLGLAMVSASQAMPITPITPAQAASEDIIQVAQGCGVGFHRGPYGACRPLYNCPRGWHTGPFGKHCVPNRRY
jgi:hypothetical protein